MAALGGQSGDIMYGTILVRLLKLDDPRSLPAFEKSSALPNSESFYTQGSVESFLLGIVGIARYAESPPLLNRPLRDDEAAWQAYREILFWLHKPSLEETSVRENCAPCWHRLMQRFIRSAIDPLMRIVQAIGEGLSTRLEFYKDPVQFFPLEVKYVVEEGLTIRSELTSLFGKEDIFRKDHGRFLVGILEQLGDETSIMALEKLLDDSQLGTPAARAIRVIRARMVVR